MAAMDETSFHVEREGCRLAGDEVGEGPPVLLLHGLTASRGYVVHGSKTLAREGHRQIAYDARGHGDSDPAPAGTGYGYPQLADDLAAVVDERAGEDPVALAGHSMGAHTVVAYAMEHPERVAALVVIGPVFLDTYDEEVLERWGRLADALEQGGIDGFLEVIGRGVDPEWRESVLRFTRERMQKHRHLGAIVDALREVPRSRPLDSLSELQFLDVPTLVVASHDDADPHHPYAVAEAYADAIPGARFLSEEEGESPLAWQGGRLSREIASFLAEPAPAERLAAKTG
jgi:pimeloyl-ACP methyl ester carboxylesterase